MGRWNFVTNHLLMASCWCLMSYFLISSCCFWVTVQYFPLVPVTVKFLTLFFTEFFPVFGESPWTSLAQNEWQALLYTWNLQFSEFKKKSFAHKLIRLFGDVISCLWWPLIPGSDLTDGLKSLWQTCIYTEVLAITIRPRNELKLSISLISLFVKSDGFSRFTCSWIDNNLQEKIVWNWVSGLWANRKVTERQQFRRSYGLNFHRHNNLTTLVYPILVFEYQVHKLLLVSGWS